MEDAHTVEVMARTCLAAVRRQGWEAFDAWLDASSSVLIASRTRRLFLVQTWPEAREKLGVDLLARGDLVSNLELALLPPVIVELNGDVAEVTVLGKFGRPPIQGFVFKKKAEAWIIRSVRLGLQALPGVPESGVAPEAI